MLPDVHPVIVASHPRSGTHLMIDLLRRQFVPCRSWKWWGERLDRLYCNVDELTGTDGILSEDTALRILQRADKPIVKTHAWPDHKRNFFDSSSGNLDQRWVGWLEENGTYLYVYRDGRDVLCSYHLFRKSFDPSARCSISTFLRQKDEGVSRVRRWADHVRAWFDQPNVHPVRFETILHEPEAALQRIGKALGVEPEMRTPLLPPPFRSIWESRWARLFRSRPESTAIINGTAKDWQDCFTAEDRLFFQEEAGDLLVELGYEPSNAWACA